MSVIALPYVIFHYAVWHYTEAIRELVLVWRNLIWFIWNFFSIPLLLGTLFSPFKRIQDEKPKGFDLEAMGGAIVVNVMMRFVGFFLRLTIATVGLATIIIFFFTAIASVVVWVLFPLIIPVLFSAGIGLLFM